MMNENGKISRSHGLPISILNQQAKEMRLPLEIPATWGDYEAKFISTLKRLSKIRFGCSRFLDIDLQAHKDWEDKVCYASGLKAILPLWQQDRITLVNEMIDNGLKP
jgi:diphthamide synthase (EF-2-diphthine--ammonia ligase)